MDEAGRGPLAGPVVAAAVILPVGARVPGVRDSKCLSAAQRAPLALAITRQATAVAVGVAQPAEIDRLNIVRAALLAMQRAVASLEPPPDWVLADGPIAPRCACPVESVVRGDAGCMSIAAASVIAKVVRDALMTDLARAYPGYGFERHKGYGTAEHHRSLQALGPCPLHRRRFLRGAAQRRLRWLETARA